MTPPPTGSDDPSSDDVDLGDLDDGDVGDDDPSEKAASDPEQVRKEAEDALAEIEALADLDEDVELDEEREPDAEPGPSGKEQMASAAPGASEDSDESTAGRDTDEDTPEDQCENCGALLHGPYCSQCGQKSADRIVPIWHMINEALEAVFELDLRVLHTLPKFLFLPGRLTKEYINGRRKRYIRPVRLYLFSTFLLFAVIALTTSGNYSFVLDPQGMARLNPPNTAVSMTAPAENTGGNESSVFGEPDQRKKMAEAIRSDSSSIDVHLYDDPEANKRLERILRVKVAQAIENPWDFVGSMIDRGPYLMFIMLPIFALLLKLLYARRARLYVEHLIFSLHLHAFTFFAFTVGVLLGQSEAGWINTAATWIEVSPLLYLVLAMRHVYDQGLLKTSIKAWVLLLVYSIILSFGFLLLTFVAVLFL